MLFYICRRGSRDVTHSNAFDRWCARIVVHRARNSTFPGQRRNSAQTGALAGGTRRSWGQSEASDAHAAAARWRVLDDHCVWR